MPFEMRADGKVKQNYEKKLQELADTSVMIIRQIMDIQRTNT